MSVSDRELSRGRVALAMLLGHLAAAVAFTFCLMLGAALANAVPLPGTLPEWVAAAQGALWFPVLVAVISAYTAIVMLPASLLTAPATWFFATELRTGVWPTVVIGAAVGIVDVAAMLWWQGTFSPGPNHAPDPWSTAANFGTCAAVAGAAYAAVVWHLCVRPRLHRFGTSRWRESV